MIFSESYLQLEIFSSFKELIHGFSKRNLGDMREDLDKFLFELGVDKGKVVRMKQVHGENVEVVGQEEQGKVILGTDGLLTSEKETFLAALTADCLPILFYDPILKKVAVNHVGWRGALSNILRNTINKLKNSGSDLNNVLVGFGPGIGSCCYNIDKERIIKFKEVFGLSVVKENYLDLFMANYLKLLDLGVKKENIQKEVYCTSCHADFLFSYRADQGLKGEMASLIGVRND